MSSPTHKTYHIDEEPVLGFDSILVKEKGSTDEDLVREIRCEICNPPEHVEASISLEYEKRDRLLYEYAYYDSKYAIEFETCAWTSPKSRIEI